MRSTTIYCETNFTTRAGGAPLSLALVCPDGSWMYAEVIDHGEDCDEFARLHVLPRFRRIPGTRFVRANGLAESARDFVQARSAKGLTSFEVRLARDLPGTRSLVQQIFALAKRDHEIVPMTVNGDLFEEFQKHCGGASRVQGHALLGAMGAALSEGQEGVVAPTSFHTASISHLELLLGSKNAVSFRAWARGRERAIQEPGQQAAA